MADQTIAIKVKVNTETGELQVLGSQMGDVAKKTHELSDGAKELASAFGTLITAGGIVKFFSDAVKGAEEQNEAFRQLKFTIDATGQSWDANKKSIQQWAEAIQQNTRFSDTEALQSLDKLARSTNNVRKAQ